jgi:hypothetical protein
VRRPAPQVSRPVVWISRFVHPAAGRRKPKNKAMTKHVNLYVPVNFDPGKLPEDRRDYACYLLNTIYWRRLCWHGDEAGFVTLTWKYLTRVIPRDLWKPIRLKLAAWGIIKTDRSAFPGEKAWGYQLTENYRRVRRLTCTNPALVRRIQRIRLKETESWGPVERWLESKLSLLQWDSRRAERIIRSLRPDADSKLTTEEYHEILFVRSEMLQNAEHFFTRDRYGRVHTPISSLPRELRCCLSVSGQRLSFIDLSNSQPLLLGLMARQFYGGSANSRYSMLNRDFGPRERNHRMKRPPRSSLKDVEDYIHLCEEGKFYEAFDELGKGREWAKRRMLVDVFFGSNKYRGPFTDRFKQQFPSIAEMIRVMKKKEHARAAWLLQELESRIFIDTICARLKAELPKLVVFTIHDCLLIRPADVPKVQGIIKEEFEKVGLQPNFKVERL